MKIRINSIVIFLLLIPIFQPKLFTQIPAFSFLYIISDINLHNKNTNLFIRPTPI